MQKLTSDCLRKVWHGLWRDEVGLNLPAVATAVAFLVAILTAVRGVIKTGEFDMLQYSFGLSVIFIGYGAAAGSRVRTNARFRKMEDRIKALERGSQ